MTGIEYGDSTPDAPVRESYQYTYDKNGNRLTETKGDEVTRNTYNSLNQMTASKKTKGSTVQSDKSYAYDANGNGQRIQKTENGETTKYYYQGDAVLATTDAEGNKTSFQLYGLEGNVIAAGRYAGSCAEST